MISILDNIIVTVLLINKGKRLEVFKARNVVFMATIFSLLLFVITIPFVGYLINFSLLMVFVCSLLLTMVASIILAFKYAIGSLSISNSGIRIKLKTGEINLDRLTIILNADEIELRKAQEHLQFETLSTVGNWISDDHSSEKSSWELVMSHEDMIKLFSLPVQTIQFKPMFKSRPLVMESPRRLFNVFSTWFVGWS